MFSILLLFFYKMKLHNLITTAHKKFYITHTYEKQYRIFINACKISESI